MLGCDQAYQLSSHGVPADVVAAARPDWQYFAKDVQSRVVMNETRDIAFATPIPLGHQPKFEQAPIVQVFQLSRENHEIPVTAPVASVYDGRTNILTRVIPKTPARAGIVENLTEPKWVICSKS